MNYQQLIAEIRSNLYSDIEHRMTVGRLINQAINGGVTWTQLVTDLGIGKSTLQGHAHTAAYWGDERATGAACWADYSHTALHARREPEAAAKIRSRMQAGEQGIVVRYDIIHRFFDEQRKAAQNVPIDRWARVDSLLASLSIELNLANESPDGERATNARQRLNDLIATLSVAPRRRVLRAA